MRVVLTVREVPGGGLAVAPGVVRTQRVDGYDVVFEIPEGSLERFEADLDRFIASSTSCYRQDWTVVTPYALSFDPVATLREWIFEWIGALETT